MWSHWRYIPFYFCMYKLCGAETYYEHSSKFGHLSHNVLLFGDESLSYDQNVKIFDLYNLLYLVLIAFNIIVLLIVCSVETYAVRATHVLYLSFPAIFSLSLFSFIYLSLSLLLWFSFLHFTTITYFFLHCYIALILHKIIIFVSRILHLSVC